MTQLIQLVYISRATFSEADSAQAVEPHVARILQQSRRNNPSMGIGGVLYYGDGCFFQCLEGEKSRVMRVLDTIRRDPRHTDVRIVFEEPVAKRQFTNWSMKYVPATNNVRALMKEAGFTRFDPYRFSDAMIRELLNTFILLRGEPPVPDQQSEQAQKPWIWLSILLAAVTALFATGSWVLAGG